MKGLHPSEDDEQIALFEWRDLHLRKYPELTLLHHIPNGKKRDIKTAVRLKKLGVKPGIPDICLPVCRPRKGNGLVRWEEMQARDMWLSLYIELKVKNGRCSSSQLDVINDLLGQGHCVLVCDGGWQQASEWIVNYLEGRLSDDDTRGTYRSAEKARGWPTQEHSPEHDRRTDVPV